MRWKIGTEMRGSVGERTDGVVMRYEVEGAQDVVTAEADGLQKGYGQ